MGRPMEARSPPNTYSYLAETIRLADSFGFSGSSQETMTNPTSVSAQVQFQQACNRDDFGADENSLFRPGLAVYLLGL